MPRIKPSTRPSRLQAPAFQPGQVVAFRPGSKGYCLGLRTAEVVHPGMKLAEFYRQAREARNPGGAPARLMNGGPRFLSPTLAPG
jgi:hypothetical protein